MLRAVTMRRVQIGLMMIGIVIVAVFALRSWRASRQSRFEESLYVPVILSPSVQLIGGQVILVKATNITEAPVSVRIMLVNDHAERPVIKDFAAIAPGNTVTHVYSPPIGTLTINESTVEVPEAVRAIIAPLPGGDPGSIRRVIANLQIVRFQAPTTGSGRALDPPIFVPLERCRFEPRRFVPYTGGRWVWNCAPEMSPIGKLPRIPPPPDAISTTPLPDDVFEKR